MRAALACAQADSSLVRLSRSIRHTDPIDGFVVGTGHSWLLLAALDDNIYLNGYIALRIADISKIAVRGGPGTFVGRALAARGIWPPVGAEVDLDGTAGLVQSAARLARLVTVHVEKEDPGVCFIGRPMRISTRFIRLLEVGTEAEWEDRGRKWLISDVTRIDFGGGYEQALALIASAPPGANPNQATGTGASMNSVRARIADHWRASEAGDLDAEHAIYAAGAILDYPQSGERFRGRTTISAQRGRHPADRHFTVRRITGRQDLWISECTITYDGVPSHTVSIMEFEDGQVVRETQYFSDSFPAPESRSDLAEPIPNPRNDET